jgi:ribonuclease HII
LAETICYTIACASIIAKVTRDRIVSALAGHYPNYRWDRNVGYVTMAHIEGLASHGVTPASPPVIHSGSAVVARLQRLWVDSDLKSASWPNWSPRATLRRLNASSADDRD